MKLFPNSEVISSSFFFPLSGSLTAILEGLSQKVLSSENVSLTTPFKVSSFCYFIVEVVHREAVHIIDHNFS